MAVDPRCPTCDRAMPKLDSVDLNIGEEEFSSCELVAITFHVRCSCGDEVGLCIRTEEDGEKSDADLN